MKYVIFDCDSTVGLPGKPMDDALALLYLLGRPREAEVLGITCTFANGTAKEVYASTKVLLEEIGRTDIPLLPGADREEDPRSEAARFITDTVNARPGEITLVAIGSLTNLYGAWLLDNTLFDKVKEIILMGGYIAPVFYHTRHLEELNFSVNPAAAACVLNHGKNISILTGNNTLEPSYLPKEEFIQKMCSGSPSGRYIAEKCGYRFDDKAVTDGDAASYCWDVVATVYLLHPELFTDYPTDCFITERGMYSGWLAPSDPAADTVVLNLPRVKDLATYREEMYSGWLDFRLGGAE
jgi:purine nucleosidase